MLTYERKNSEIDHLQNFDEHVKEVPESKDIKGGKYNDISVHKLAYESMTYADDVRFFSATTIREKCENCTVISPCCEADCDVHEDLKSMDMDPCHFCPQKIDNGIGCTNQRLHSSTSDLRKSLKEFTLETDNGSELSYEEIKSMPEGSEKNILTFRFINEFFRHIGREDLIFKYRKERSRYKVQFCREEYTFPGDISALDMIERVLTQAS